MLTYNRQLCRPRNGRCAIQHFLGIALQPALARICSENKRKMKRFGQRSFQSVCLYESSSCNAHIYCDINWIYRMESYTVTSVVFPRYKQMYSYTMQKISEYFDKNIYTQSDSKFPVILLKFKSKFTQFFFTKVSKLLKFFE